MTPLFARKLLSSYQGANDKRGTLTSAFPGTCPKSLQPLNRIASTPGTQKQEHSLCPPDHPATAIQSQLGMPQSLVSCHKWNKIDKQLARKSCLKVVKTLYSPQKHSSLRTHKQESRLLPTWTPLEKVFLTSVVWAKNLG